MQLNFYDHKAVQYNRAMDIYHQYRIFASEDGKEWTLVIDKSDSDKDCPPRLHRAQRAVACPLSEIRECAHAYGKCRLVRLPRVFGNGDGDVPQAVKGLTVKRDRKDRRNALISWQPEASAYGYNIYYGTAEGKMYNAITVLGQTEYDFRGLDADTDYYFTIEALNENGRSPLCKTTKN